jgi:hypothetical protein
MSEIETKIELINRQWTIALIWGLVGFVALQFNLLPNWTSLGFLAAMMTHMILGTKLVTRINEKE